MFGLDKPENIRQLRIMYMTATAIYFSIGLLIWQIIRSKPNPAPLVYDEPVNGQEEPTHVETTVSEYDLSQIEKMLKGSIPSTLVIVALHYYFKVNQPLIIQSVLPIITILRSPLFGIHILGMKPTGSFERPWINRSSFGNAMNQPAASNSDETTATATPSNSITASNSATADKKAGTTEKKDKTSAETADKKLE
ncbi:hypothetical protein BB560_003549 [Smittium megazygosporum]|uniref:Inorganic phosphate transporter Pho88 n=1 Tax=Smittium megazygosporum TaxID=133381 RepID=A0A2T9ZBM6_9FUNG|nr:hypothetical protein BB560_003549 [Smittium megazygosporum]